ncbi:MAG: ribosome silencing factor [Clostridiales bacterium]|nr:ribosome silencing factor [Clostridiales bacterium]MBP3811050.1 ribosome silencing factor [Clostridiales bacterium]
MTSEELAGKIVSILETKKGSDIEVIDVAEKTTLADFFIICTGNSTTQIKALADEVEYILKNEDQILADHVEGRSGDKWILIDFKDVVVHVMHPEVRASYDLESLWIKK